MRFPPCVGLSLVLMGCGFDPAREYPAPDAWPKNRGPGAPKKQFQPAELLKACAFIDGGDDDVSDHHNLVVMLDGYLLMPWAPETGQGGLTFFDISEPCQPRRVGTGSSAQMRETHAVGFSSLGGRWVVTAAMTNGVEGGIQFWDVADTAAPRVVSTLHTPDFAYPDAYDRVTLSAFWQVPYVYVGGADNGVFIVDATDPRAPKLVGHYRPEPVMRVGQVQAVGNLLVVTSAEGPRTLLLDISDPLKPAPIPGGDFIQKGREGLTRSSYFSNAANGYIYYARKERGGGLTIFDIHDPSKPRLAGEQISEGAGGYVFMFDHYAFVGESNFATIYDVSNLDAVHEVKRLHLSGDLDTVTPIGNLAILSVDARAEPDKATSIMPWRAEPDDTAPHVTWSWPRAGEIDLPLTSRLGLTFNEHIDPSSAFAGSVRLYRPGYFGSAVEGHVSAQEAIVNFVPVAPLEPDAEYVLEVPAGGITDYSGNAVVEPFELRFRTVKR